MALARLRRLALTLCLLGLPALLAATPASTNDTLAVSTSRNSKTSRKSALCPAGWRLATSSHVEYGHAQKKYCVKLNRKKLTWQAAVNNCRRDMGFMLKLDGILNSEGGTLFEHLSRKGVKKVWTGIHEEHGKLVWDGLRPTMVRAYHGPSQQFGWRIRGWGFDEDSFSTIGGTCGALHFESSESRESDQSGESWNTRLRSAFRRFKHRERRSPLHGEVKPSMPTPLLSTLKIDAEDLPSNKNPIEELQQFLANSGFQEKHVEVMVTETQKSLHRLARPSPTEFLSHSDFLSHSKRSRRMLTTPKTTKTTDQSNVDDDDHQSATIPKPDVQEGARTTVAPPLSHSNSGGHPTSSPLLHSLRQSTASFLAESLSLQGNKDNPSSIDQILDLLLQTTMAQQHSNVSQEKSASNGHNYQTTTSRYSNSSNNALGLDPNLYLQQLLHQASVTASPSPASTQDQALDILSHLLASAMDNARPTDNISLKTSTSIPKEQKQINGLVPSSLDPNNFILDLGVGEQRSNDQSMGVGEQRSSDQSVGTVDQRSGSDQSLSSTETRGRVAGPIFGSSSAQHSASTTSMKSEERNGKDFAKRGWKDKIRESTASLFGQLLPNLNFFDRVVTTPPPVSRPTVSSPVPPSTGPVVISTRRLGVDWLNDGGNHLVSKDASSAIIDNTGSKSSTGKDKGLASLESGLIDPLSANDITKTGTSTLPSTTTTVESGGNSGEDDNSYLDMSTMSTTTISTSSTTLSEEPGGDSGEEDIRKDNNSSTTTVATSTTSANVTFTLETSKEKNQVSGHGSSTINDHGSSEVTENTIIFQNKKDIVNNKSKNLEDFLSPDTSSESEMNATNVMPSSGKKSNNETWDVIDSNNISSEKQNIDLKDMNSIDGASAKQLIYPDGNNSAEVTSYAALVREEGNNDVIGNMSAETVSRVTQGSEEVSINQVEDYDDIGNPLNSDLSSPGISGSEITGKMKDRHVGLDKLHEELLNSGETLTSTDSPQSAEEVFGSGLASKEISAPRETIVMEECEGERMSSVCVTEPLEEIGIVGHCDRNWFGHRLLDRCYRPLTSAMTELEARQRCLRYGATLAMADTDFYGNVTDLVMRQGMDQRAGKRAWVDTSLNLGVSIDSQCSAIEDGHLHKVDCMERMPLICQKDARTTDNTLQDIDKARTAKTHVYIHNTTSFHPQTLRCPLRMTAFDDVIIWYKDGQPITDKEPLALPKFGPIRARLSSHLPLDLSILLRVGHGVVSIPKPAMLQGSYWCEIWRHDLFHREVSHQIHLRFTDVLTIHGTIHTESFSDVTAVLANQMGHLTGRAGLIGRHLSLINKNTTHFLRAKHQAVRDIIGFVKEIRAEEGQITFYAYISLRDGDVPLEDRGDLVNDYTTALRDAMTAEEEEVRQEWKVTLPLDDAITISLPDLCPMRELLDEKTGLAATFPTTGVNSGSLSVEVCDGIYSGTAWCRGDLLSGAYWDSWHITGSCHQGQTRAAATATVSSSEKSGGGSGDSDAKDVSDKSSENDEISMEDVIKVNNGFVLRKRPNSALLELDEVEVEEDNLEEVSEKLAEVLELDDDLSEVDIETVADVVEKIMAVNMPSLQISNRLLDTVDKVLDAPTENLKKAELETRASTRLIDDLEDFGEKAKMGSKVNTHRHVTPNVAMELWDLKDHSDVVVGLGVTGVSGWTSPLSESRITTIKDRAWMNDHLADFDIAIELPESLVENSVRYSEDSLRLSMFVYRKVGLFMSDDPVTDDLQDTVINSGVISASLGGRKVKGLEDKIRLVFKPFQAPQAKESRTRCVFWDTTKVKGGPSWSQDGCVYNGSRNGLEVCLCDHLTNFAILLDFYGDSRPLPVEHQTSLSILTLVGISLSMGGLLITIITFLAFKKLRQGRAQQTLFNMAISLLCFQATFLMGFKQTSIRPLCLTVAVSLHYFILVSFAWMLIEAVLQYLTFVKVLGTYIPRYTLKTALPAWLLPLIPVAAVLITDYRLYLGRSDYCWMDVTAFYYSFAMPVGIIIVFNIVMFFIILASLVTRPQGLRSNQNNNKARETNLKAALTIFILLGLTWVFGYMAVEDARLPFQYTFTVLSSLQGFLIFVLMVLRRKQVRDQWRMLFCRHGNASKPKQKKLSPVSSSSMSSSNGNGLPSFYNHTYTTASSSCINSSDVYSNDGISDGGVDFVSGGGDGLGSDVYDDATGLRPPFMPGFVANI